MCSRALRAPLHRLADEQRQAEHGVQVQRQERLREGRVPGLSQEPLQHAGLRHQEGAQRCQQEALPEDTLQDALQTYVLSTINTLRL